MKIKITLDNLDEAIRELRELANKIENFPHDLAKEFEAEINYHTRVDRKKDSTSIIAYGEGIAFEEYGAGFIADEAMIGDLETYPGVWSEDHSGTFEKWQNNGQDPDKYPYNREPKRYMRNAIEKLETETEARAKGYFE